MAERTRLVVIDWPEQLVVRLRFGRPIKQREMDDGTAYVWFEPNQRFGVHWWVRLSPRKQWACFAVVESCCHGEAGYRLPCIAPAVRVHLWLSCRCRGQDQGVVGRVESLIHHIEMQGVHPCDVPASYYQAAAQSLRVGREPRTLSAREVNRYRKANSHAK